MRRPVGPAGRSSGPAPGRGDYFAHKENSSAAKAQFRINFVVSSTDCPIQAPATIMHMPRAQFPDLGTRRSGGSGDLRHGNLTQILRYVRDHGASSRHDIARGCGLGISTMTDLIGELRTRRLVRELDPIRRPGAGRPTRPIAFDGEPWYVLGVHVDVDHISVAATTVGGRELWQETTEVDLRGAGPAGFGTLQDLLHKALGRIPGDKRLVAVEIGVPGYVAADRGTVSTADGLDWQDFELGSAVDQTLRDAGHHPRLRRRQRRVPACCALRQPGRARPASGQHRRLHRRPAARRQRRDHPRRDLPRRGRRGRGLRPPQRGDGRTPLLVRPPRLPGVLVGPAALLVSTGLTGPKEAEDLVDSDSARARDRDDLRRCAERASRRRPAPWRPPARCWVGRSTTSSASSTRMR